MKFMSNASFWLPEFFHHTGWERHIPFAFYLVDTLRPKTIVELGTFTGLSYFAFCQAVAWLSLETLSTAVDTWSGDQGGLEYRGDEVFASVADHNRKYQFSRLIREDFAAAVGQFEDLSIDLLHIDGDHLYESVAADFRNYYPKLSHDAIVLFHDTRLGGESGVWRVFEGLLYPKFEFFHGSGLGMIAMGKFPEELRPWFEAPRQHLDWIRRLYEHLGESIEERATLDIEERVKPAQRIVNLTAAALMT